MCRRDRHALNCVRLLHTVPSSIVLSSALLSSSGKRSWEVSSVKPSSRLWPSHNFLQDRAEKIKGGAEKIRNFLYFIYKYSNFVRIFAIIKIN